MSDEPENLTLRYLRRIDEKLDRVIAKQDEHTRRIGALEQSVARLHGSNADVVASVAELSVRMDDFDRRVSRIERRLDLVEEGQP